MSGKAKIAREVAEADFGRLCDAQRIDQDTSQMAETELAEWNELKGRIVRDLMTGVVIVGADGLATFTPAGSTTGLTFHKTTGATYIALETYAGTKNMQNLIAAMAEMTRSDRGEFSKMEAWDFQVCLRLGKLFLADR